LDQLDPTNVLDAQGILKLTERATRLALETSGHRMQQELREQREKVERQLGELEELRRGAELRREEELAKELERAMTERTRNN
jgi:hypothetical protein